MPAITQPLRDEHRELLPHIEHLRIAADAVGELSDVALKRRLDGVHDFLLNQLIPHAEAEDKALYPVVAKAMGAAQATATMSRDHVEVGRLTHELGALRGQLTMGRFTSAQENALRRVLYGLYALVKVHFAKEEEIYLPLLDARLAPDEAQKMFEEMARLSHGGHSHH